MWLFLICYSHWDCSAKSYSFSLFCNWMTPKHNKNFYVSNMNNFSWMLMGIFAEAITATQCFPWSFVHIWACLGNWLLLVNRWAAFLQFLKGWMQPGWDWSDDCVVVQQLTSCHPIWKIWPIISVDGEDTAMASCKISSVSSWRVLRMIFLVFHFAVLLNGSLLPIQPSDP